MEKIDLKKALGTDKLFSVLFKAKEDAHITHLMQPTQSYSDHMALADFYDGLGCLVDALVEMYYGANGTESEPIVFTSKVITGSLPNYFKKLLNQVKAIRNKYKGAYMAAKIDEIEMLIVHTIYKLENTRSNV